MHLMKLRILGWNLAIGFLASTGILHGQSNERNVLLSDTHSHLKTLEQNWEHDESNWFYNVPQGSRILPYDWMLSLEQKGNRQKFLSDANVRKFGFIPRSPSEDNPDGLPIGFVKDAKFDDGRPSMGLTCAACHTGQISFGETLFLVDGAPSLGDIETLMQDLASALEETSTDRKKFDRFAEKVLGGSASSIEKLLLLGELKAVYQQRSGYNHRNFPAEGQTPFGFGRVDAFGAILNEISVKFLSVPANHHPADAPVSYPFLWDAPQHDRVQWNGAAENKTSKIGRLLFGTSEVGALGRNAGEVLGVFGSVDINDSELFFPRPYTSTVNKQNLLAIENSLKTLWSPVWPSDFPAIEVAARDRGARLFKDNCAHCHEQIDRTSPARKVLARMEDVGTDPTMVKNFGRIVSTGKLEGRLKTISDLTARFGKQEPVALLLKHVVERSILRSINEKKLLRALASKKKSLLRDLTPGFQSTAIIELDGEQAKVALDSVVSLDQGVRIFSDDNSVGRLRSALSEKLGPSKRQLLSSLGGLAEGTEEVLAKQFGEVQESGQGGESDIRLQNASVRFAYKARPLNGIWATAPYLHNGSVRTLMDLLRPACERAKSFHVGSIEFDAQEVGFVNDPDFPVFDTTLPGNSNSGHEYGATLNEQERKDLVEYLKAL